MEYESPMDQALVCPLLDPNESDKNNTTTSGFWSFWKMCQKDTNQDESLKRHSTLAVGHAPTNNDNDETVVPIVEIHFVHDNDKKNTSIHDWLELELLEEGSLWSFAADLDAAVSVPKGMMIPHSTTTRVSSSNPIPNDIVATPTVQRPLQDTATTPLQAWHAATVARRRRRRQRQLLGALIGMAAFMATASGLAIWSAHCLAANDAPEGESGAQQEEEVVASSSTAHP